jgi:hypothetical protein
MSFAGAKTFFAGAKIIGRVGLVVGVGVGIGVVKKKPEAGRDVRRLLLCFLLTNLTGEVGFE